MRPWQNALAILATFIAAGALLPWPARLRIVAAVVAGLIIVVLAAFRVSAHMRLTSSATTEVTMDMVDRIREERARRYRR